MRDRPAAPQRRELARRPAPRRLVDRTSAGDERLLQQNAAAIGARMVESAAYDGTMRVTKVQLIAIATVVACRSTGRSLPPEPAYGFQPQPTPAAADCSTMIPMVALRNASGTLPEGVSETDALNAAVQFLVMSGDNIASKDETAHVVTTKPRVGQTVLTRCRPINHYRVYVQRVSIVGGTIFVSTDCWGSTGWEADGRVPAHRDPISICTVVSEGDAAIADGIVEGTLEVLKLRAIPH